MDSVPETVECVAVLAQLELENSAECVAVLALPELEAVAECVAVLALPEAEAVAECAGEPILRGKMGERACLFVYASHQARSTHLLT